MNSEEVLKSRLSDLSQRAFERNYSVFSDFLTIEEIRTLESMKTTSSYVLFGGYDDAERAVAGFGDDVEKAEFPIDCIEITPLSQKFADKLSHRDFLGAVMNLGINRNTLGDIIISENVGYLFCLNTISEYICENLSRIKHTSVSCAVIDSLPDCAKKKPVDKEVIVPSTRADAVVSAVYHISRNAAKQLFSQEKVFVNHRVAGVSQTLKACDIVSVRGYGKFTIGETLRNTKKDRIVLSVGIYV